MPDNDGDAGDVNDADICMEMMKAGQGYVPLTGLQPFNAVFYAVLFRAAADRAMLKIVGVRDRLRHRVHHRGQQQVVFATRKSCHQCRTG